MEEISRLRKYVDSHGFWIVSNEEIQREPAESLCRTKELRKCSDLVGWPTGIPKGAQNFYVPFAIKSVYGMPHSLWRHLVEGVGC